jgi:hypothetical protein
MHLTLLSGGMGERFYPRHIDAGEFFEDFLISAVAAILTIRVFLHLTGYPIVGGGTLHIAHMLWGGLLMALAWARLEAPDIALAEAAIGAGLTGALLLDAVGQMARSSTDRDRTQANDGEGMGDGEP